MATSLEPAVVSGQEPAIRCGDVERSWSAVRERAARLATGFAGLGVEPGDRIALLMRNQPAFAEVSLAAGLLGAQPVAVNWHFTGDDLRHVLADSAPRVIVADADLAPTRELAGAASVLSTPALDTWSDGLAPWTTGVAAPPTSVIYTSGTTGNPKGITRSQISDEQRLSGFRTSMQTQGIAPGVRSLLAVPLYHTAPNVALLTAAALEVDLTLHDRFHPEQFLATVEERRIQQTFMVPTMFVRLLRLPEEVRNRYDLSSLQTVVHAAAPCPPHVKARMIEWLGPIVVEYYGGSETGLVTWCDSHEWLAHPGTVGRAFGTGGVRILGSDGAELAPGEDGEVYLKPLESWPDFTYRGDDAKRSAMEIDGYFTIGDIGYLDADGYLYLADRRSDMVISGGVNIYPAEIEGCLLALPGVLDVAVLGVPDEEYGEALAAHVHADPDAGLTATGVQEHVRAHLAGYKVPRTVVFDDNLPRDESGKLYKRRIKAHYLKEN